MRLPVLLAVLALPASDLCADEVRLRDGRVLVGRVETKGKVTRVHTRDGVVKVATTDVERVRTEEELRVELQRLELSSKPSAFHALQLARTARDFDLEDALWSHLDRALALAKEEGETPASLWAFLGELEPYLLNSRVRGLRPARRVDALIALVRGQLRPSRRAAITAVLTAMPDADRSLQRVARSGASDPRRLTALDALAARGGEDNLHFLYRTPLLDRDRDVRSKVVASIRDLGEAEGAVQYLAPGLLQSAETRVRTAQVYGALRDPSAVDLLVAAAGALQSGSTGLPGGSVRAHAAFLNQQAYVADFDVEIAQNSFIADPQVRNLQSGAVLDATVLGVSSVQTRVFGSYRKALTRITGSDPGGDPARWPLWRDGLRDRPASRQ